MGVTAGSVEIATLRDVSMEPDPTRSVASD
jgi:hypothetical protein